MFLILWLLHQSSSALSLRRKINLFSKAPELNVVCMMSAWKCGGEHYCSPLFVILCLLHVEGDRKDKIIILK